MEYFEYADSENKNQHDLEPEVRSAVDNAKTSMMEDVHFKLVRERVESLDVCRETIVNRDLDETAILDLSLEERLSLIEEFSEECSCVIGAVRPQDMRKWIDVMATWIIFNLATQEAQAALTELEDFMEEHEFTFKNLVEGNMHGWARHYGEREEGEYCQVYEYRNLEGEGIHVDVYEYSNNGLEVTFERYIPKDSVSQEEAVWDAT